MEAASSHCLSGPERRSGLAQADNFRSSRAWYCCRWYVGITESLVPGAQAIAGVDCVHVDRDLWFSPKLSTVSHSKPGRSATKV